MANREIKFRVWHKDHKKMEYPDIKLKDDSDSWDGVYGSVCEIVNSYFRNAADRIWLQYTGLKDKNGVDIYEEDILLCKSFYSAKSLNKKIYKAIVVYNPGIFIPKALEETIILNFDDCEIIGNIHETPELL